MKSIVQLDLYVAILIMTVLFTITNALLQSTPLLSRKLASKVAVDGLINLENGNLWKQKFVAPHGGPISISRLDASPRKIDVGDGVSSFGQVRHFSCLTCISFQYLTHVPTCSSPTPAGHDETQSSHSKRRVLISKTVQVRRTHQSPTEIDGYGFRTNDYR